MSSVLPLFDGVACGSKAEMVAAVSEVCALLSSRGHSEAEVVAMMKTETGLAAGNPAYDYHDVICAVLEAAEASPPRRVEPAWVDVSRRTGGFIEQLDVNSSPVISRHRPRVEEGQDVGGWRPGPAPRSGDHGG